MAEKKDKNTFNTRVNECCSDDKLRPAMQCVHFVNGYAYASNGFLAIKQTLSFQSVLTPENLDGHSLHRDSYRAIMGFDIAQANTDGIECWTDDGQHVFFEYFEYKNGEKMPDIEAMIKPKRGLTQLSFIGIDSELLQKLNKALYIPNEHSMRLQFTGIDSAILVDVPGVDEQAAIVMPKIINATLF